ncbi:ArnT family glycosyltransferase [Oenococcus kitaharae]|uniref:Putative integral membrane protein n=1 Tax=Oenococcus kitaharae DSM 17330 TaxID=1045004 RepID=G9WG17_9LACO|nr:glycosyltransferase family 39 protein [Oenococcus kitaharae]EHN59595.1 putative integral membrane protein [Oenococcus kitaharae DSM 17330]
MKREKIKKIDYVLLAILCVAAFLYLFNLNRIGNANPFYTAAVGSMSRNWKAFFFSSFDPTNFISVDKPPVALWMMVLSAKIFSLSGWSTALPSVLCSLGSIFLLFKIVQTTFGNRAGHIAALLMTLTPIVVADARSNNMDAVMLFFLLLAARLLEKFILQHHLINLIAAFASVGLAFNVKMLEAFMILPAMFLYFWLATSDQHLKKRMAELLAALLTLLTFSFAYPVVVDHIPENQRPYVGSSQNDSMANLVFGYNGSQRLLGQTSGISASHKGMKNSFFAASDYPTPIKQQSPMRILQRLGHPGNIGQPGPFRLFSLALGTQISWYLPLALFGLLAAIIHGIRRFKAHQRKLTQKGTQIVFWGSYLISIAAFFSVAGFFHPYYTNILAPAIAALAAIFITSVKKDQLLFGIRNKGAARAGAAGVFLGTILLQSYFSWYYAELFVTIFFVLVLIMSLYWIKFPVRYKKTFQIALIAACLIPGLWSTVPLFGASASFPAASPRLLLHHPVGQLISTYLDPKRYVAASSLRSQRRNEAHKDLLSFLKSRYSQNRRSQYLFATINAPTAAPFMIQSHKAVMAIGGYNGTDPAISLDRFKRLVFEHKIKYFYFGSSGLRSLNPRSQNAKIADWVIDRGRVIKSVSDDHRDPQHKNQLYQINQTRDQKAL